MHPAKSPTAGARPPRDRRTPVGRRRLWRATAAAIIAAPVLFGAAACGDDDAGSTDPNAPATIEVFWWGGESRGEATEKALELYKKKRPNVTINATWQAFDGYYDKLATISAGGNAPDIFQIDDNGLAEYAGRNVTLDLTQYVKDNKIDLSKHAEGLTKYGQIDEKQVAVATGENTPAMVYDKTKLTQLGLPEPQEGWSYEQLFDWAAQVSAKGGGKYWGTMDTSSDYKALWLWLRAQGKEFYDGNKLAFTEADLAAWFKLWQGARAKNATPPAAVVHEAVTGSVATQLVVTGKAATSFMWSNQLTELQKATKNELGMVAYPGDPKGQWARASLYWAASRSTEHKDVVADLINFLVNDPEVAELFGVDRGLPSNMDTRKAIEASVADPAVKTTIAFENALAPKFGEPPAPPPKGHSGLRNKLRDIAESVSYGKATPEAAATQFFAEAQAALG
jgi:multiple sugar transport system substrate-binding protein